MYTLPPVLMQTIYQYLLTRPWVEVCKMLDDIHANDKEIRAKQQPVEAPAPTTPEQIT